MSSKSISESKISLCCKCSDTVKQRHKVYGYPSKRHFVVLLRCCSTLCFSWTLFQFIPLYGNCTAVLCLNSGGGFNGSSLPVLDLVTAIMNCKVCSLHVLWKTQPLEFYVRLIVCIILQSMSRVLGRRCQKAVADFCCALVTKQVQRILMITGD